MTLYEKLHKKYPKFDKIKIRAKTEKAVCYALEEAGFNHNGVFKTHVKIDGVPFNNSKIHEVDLKLISIKGEELFVEVKGEMTLLETNKLRYLFNETSLNFYLIQLTDIDWIEPYSKEKYQKKSIKSKQDFDTQIFELVSFIKGEITGEEMSARSKKRLEDYIEFRAKDLETWISRKEKMTNNQGIHA